MINNYLDDLIGKIKHTIPGFISVGIMNFEGSILAKEQMDPRVNVDLEVAFQLEIIKQAMKSLSVSELNRGNKLKDILIETEKFAYLLSLSNSQKAVLVLMLDAQTYNLGITRSLLAKAKDEFGARLDRDL